MTPAERSRLHTDLTALADGDRSAFSAVFAAAHPLVERLASRMLAGSPDAEDAAQTALLKVFERASEFDSDRDALSWILGIAAWECRTVRRRAGRRRDAPVEASTLDAFASSADPAGDAMAHEVLGLLEETLGSLSPTDRATLEVVLERAPRPAVAAATFRKRLQRATERLRLAWRNTHGQ
jgi:RNA polymerase sigma factor (sigma-70 family)